MTKGKNKRAFTLIELLIVIAIIGILFIVLVSKVDFATDKAKATGVQTDFRSFQVAFETVSQEYDGFASLGWDTGDTSKDSLWNNKTTPDGQIYSYENQDKDAGDRIRNSYDMGDANLNGKEDVGETFVGRKFYTEEWTNVYTLVNPGNADDTSAIEALERVLNSNLDPKLHITIAAPTADNDYKYMITMANQAQDPWKNEYHGEYITNAHNDGMDRGAIVIYSDGANGKHGTTHAIAGGIVRLNIPGNNVAGQDDYTLVSCSSFKDGSSSVVTSTGGFAVHNKNYLSGHNSATIQPQANNAIGTWTLNGDLSNMACENLFFNVDFTTNGLECFGISVSSSGPSNNPVGWYVDFYSWDLPGCHSVVYDIWNAELRLPQYTTITITGGDDVTNPQLLSWLNNYATRVN